MDRAPESQATRWLRYRVVLYLLLGLVALDAVVAHYRKVWRSYDPDDYLVRVQDCRRQQPDLVLVGGSPVCEGLDPAVLTGLSWHGQALEHVYNLGLPGATTAEVWHGIEHGIAKPPRLLIYGITASDLNDGREEPHGPRSLMDMRDVARWVGSRNGAALWCIRQFLEGQTPRPWNLYYYRNGIRLWAADHMESLWPGLAPEAAAEAREGLRYTAAMRQNHGFAPRPQFQTQNYAWLKSLGLEWKRFHFLENYHLGRHLAYLHRLLDWADEQGVAIVLVDMPVTADLECKLHPAAFATYRAALAEVEQTRGVCVLRASRAAVGVTDADFADLIHLNASGTARLSAWLRQALTNHFTSASVAQRERP